MKTPHLLLNGESFFFDEMFSFDNGTRRFYKIQIIADDFAFWEGNQCRIYSNESQPKLKEAYKKWLISEELKKKLGEE